MIQMPSLYACTLRREATQRRIAVVLVDRVEISNLPIAIGS
jgi:hypothetical protein